MWCFVDVCVVFCRRLACSVVTVCVVLVGCMQCNHCVVFVGCVQDWSDERGGEDLSGELMLRCREGQELP